MIIRIFILIFGIVIFIYPYKISGQEAVITTGGHIENKGGSASFTIGQVAYTTQFGINGSVAAGIQQAYEISVVTEAESTEDIFLSCSVFPNPTTGFLYLQINSFKYKDISYQLFDVSGTLLKKQKIETDKTTIPMLEYVPAAYFLKVWVNQTNVKTFKIIKH